MLKAKNQHDGRKTITIGLILALLSALFGSFADVLPKPMLSENSGITNPTSITAIMFLIPAMIFTVLIQTIAKVKRFQKYRQIPLSKIRKNDKIFLGIVSVVEATATVLFYFGLQKTSATNGAILGNMDIVFTMFIAMIFLKEKLRRLEIIPFLLIVLGSIILPMYLDVVSDIKTSPISIGKEFGSDAMIGNWLIITSCLFYGIEMILFKKISENIGSLRVMEVTSYITGITALAFSFMIFGSFRVDYIELPSLSVIGMFGIGISVLFLVAAIQRIGPTRSIILFSTTTIFGILLSSVLLSEIISEIHVVAVGLIITGTFFLRNKMAIF